MSISITNTNTNTDTSFVTNNNNSNTSNTSSVGNPSMQDLMSLLQDQSKVISSLQRTIDDLNITIKSLNDKIEKMEADKNVGKISINVTTGSKNAHLKPVHENFESATLTAFKLKCKNLLLQ